MKILDFVRYIFIDLQISCITKVYVKEIENFSWDYENYQNEYRYIIQIYGGHFQLDNNMTAADKKIAPSGWIYEIKRISYDMEDNQIYVSICQILNI